MLSWHLLIVISSILLCTHLEIRTPWTLLHGPIYISVHAFRPLKSGHLETSIINCFPACCFFFPYYQSEPSEWRRYHVGKSVYVYKMATCSFHPLPYSQHTVSCTYHHSPTTQIHLKARHCLDLNTLVSNNGPYSFTGQVKYYWSLGF